MNSSNPVSDPYQFPVSMYPVKAGDWDGKLSETGLGRFKFKNRVPNEPLDFVEKRAWIGWTQIDHCKICGGGPFQTTYEITFEWGDTKKYEYITEVCIHCLRLLNENVVRNKQVPLKYD